MSRALFPAWKTSMLKLTVVILGVALAGTASAAGWRSMRIDASSEASFNESVAALQDKLPRVRRRVLEQLSMGPATVSELAAPFDMQLPSFVQTSRLRARRAAHSCLPHGCHTEFRPGSLTTVSRVEVQHHIGAIAFGAWG